jgi:hypothetical protein
MKKCTRGGKNKNSPLEALGKLVTTWPMGKKYCILPNLFIFFPQIISKCEKI